MDHRMKAQEAMGNELQEAQAVLAANKGDFEKWRVAATEAKAMGDPLPAPPPSIAGAIATVGNVLGNVAVGVGGTAADAVSIVGGTADALHGGVNDFFSNLRRRLGV